MNIDFSTMDGYEFEDYISNLFRKLGFEVEATNYSNDGGVDLVATYKQPVFSGKYVIQCKNWSGLVGQPEVRDLYGVVMDCRANKGIIITPSDYTEQAYAFADGKNLELINGVILRQLEDAVQNQSPGQTNKSSTRELFRNERYTYLENLINEEPSEVKNYILIINYLREFLKQQDMDTCSIELFDTLLEWIEKMKSRCFKTASKANDREMAKVLQAEALILSGRLAEATEILLRTNLFWIRSFSPRDGIYYISQDMLEDGTYDYGYSYSGLYAWNLYAAFKYIGYERGCQLIVSRLRYTDGALSDYYNKKIFGRLFIFSSPNMRTVGSGKTKHFDSTEFWGKDVHNPEKFFKKFYVKSAEEYAKEIDEVFKVHGIQ